MRCKLTIIVFIILLSLPLANTVIRIIRDISSTDSELSSHLPPYSVNFGKFFIREYLRDNFSFKDFLIQLNSSLAYSIFNTSTHRDVIIGKQGWLYYTADGALDDYHGKLVLNESNMENTRKFFLEIKEYIESHGAVFLILACPDPLSIYDEFLPEHEFFHLGGTTRLDQYIQYFKENDGPEILDLREATLAAKAESDEWIYYSNDTHWNLLAVNAAYRELINHLNQNGFSIVFPDYTIESTTLFSGDLARFFPAYSLPKSKDHLFVFPETTIEKNGQIVISNAPNNMNFAMIFDSYGIVMTNLLSATFTNNFFPPIHTNHYSDLILENVQEIMTDFKPDIFVLQFGERVVGKYWPEFKSTTEIPIK